MTQLVTWMVDRDRDDKHHVLKIEEDMDRDDKQHV